MQFSPPEIWKWHAVLLGIQARNNNIKDFTVFCCQSEDTVERIWKDLNESNGDYKGMAGEKPPSDLSDKKRNFEFVGKIQPTIENDPSKSFRSIARDMEVSAGKHLVFLIEDEKVSIFITAHEGWEEI